MEAFGPFKGSNNSNNNNLSGWVIATKISAAAGVSDDKIEL